MDNESSPIIWSIAGADCSGGAGIAADIKTAHSLGLELCHLITANTVQNSQRLYSVNPVAVELLQQQVLALSEDNPPTVIKIGLLANIAQVNWLVSVIQQLKAQRKVLVVYDPVGQASVGGAFSSLSTEDLSTLLRLTDVLTPNLPEAQQLSGCVSTDRQVLAAKLLQLGVSSVIIKGGHDAGPLSLQQSSDYGAMQVSGQAEPTTYQLSSPRLATNYSHGGGCSFATAIAVFIASGYLFRDAFTLAKAFINQGLAASLNDAGNNADYYGAFKQRGWPEQAQYFPRVTGKLAGQWQGLTEFASLGIMRDGSQALGLYPVIDSLDWLKRLLPLHVNIIQLRLKNIPNTQLEPIIAEAIALCHGTPTRLFINDHWQLAIKHRAYGVHLGQDDVPQADLFKIQAAGLRLGISTHGCYELLLAQQLKPSYLAIGAIFSTQTKDMSGQIQGLANLRQLLKLATHIPVVAIGGITSERAKAVWQTGVDGIAVVTAITQAQYPERVVNAWQRLLSKS